MAHHVARRLSPRRRLVAVVLGLTGMLGLGVAWAAQLNVGSATVGAGATTVAACQPADQAISVSFTTAWSATAPAGYRASAVTISNVNGACAGLSYRIRVLNSSGGALGNEVLGTVPTGAGPFTLSGSLGTAQLVTSISSVSVVIHG